MAEPVPPPADTSPPDGRETASPGPVRRRGWRLPAIVFGVLAVLVALLVGGGWQALRTEAGTRWLLSKVDGLRITEGRGSLSGGPFSADIVEFELENSPVQVRIEGLAWRDLGWRWRPYPGAWAGLVVEGLQARSVQVRTRPKPGPRSPPPQRLRLPFELHVPGARVGVLRIDDQRPLQDLAVSLHLGTEGGTLHRVDELAFTWDRLQVRGQASLGADAPLPVALQVEARSTPQPKDAGVLGRPWRAQLRAAGPLARVAVDGQLQPADAAPGSGPSATVRAVAQPFEPWPLAAFDATLRDVDLAALLTDAPVTRLSGRAVVSSSAADRPAEVDLRLTNALPGRWDEQRLPLREVVVDLQARPDRPSQVTLRSFDLHLGDAQDPAGRWRGQGRWADGRLQLESRVDDLRPNLLDRRAPGMRLSGPADGWWQALDGGGWHAGFDARLQGALLAAKTPETRLDARGTVRSDADGLALRLDEFAARAAGALASGRLDLARRPDARWTLASRGSLQQFDPAVWWPGPEGSAWRQGGHRLNGRWEVDLRGAPGPFVASWPWPGWQGRLGLVLDDSRLAQVPLSGQAQWQASGPQAGRLAVDLKAAGSTLQVNGERVAARDDRWTLQVDAPALAPLAPLLALLPASQAWAPTQGRLSLRASAQGSWPRMAWTGEVSGADLRAGGWQAAALQGRWRLGGGPSDPLELVVGGDRLALGVQKVDRVRAEVSGTTGAHRFQLQADTSARPPRWTDVLVGPGAGRGTAVRLQGQGRWQSGPEGARWQGELQQLRAGSGQADGGWLQADAVQAEMRFDERLGLQSLQVQPGRLRLLGAALRWNELRWQSGTATSLPRLNVQAELEPLKVAPLLATLQPDFGWGGDLVVQGRVMVRTADEFAADVVLERVGGDLSVTDEGGTQSLGLTDLRLAMLANQGVWHFTQGIAGTHVGVLGGAQSLRTSPRAVWPSADTPLEGVVELRVDNLGAWGAWTPPGWRLSGQLHTSATLGGRFGAPQYTGRVEGRQLGVRNLLYGVNVTDGDVLIALTGPTAQIERFIARAGDGVLRLEGGASFGDEPRARLRVNAGRFQVLGRVDRRIVTSGQAELTLEPDTVALQGRFIVDEGLVDFSRADAPTLDDDVTVVRRVNGRRVTTSAEDAAPQEPSPTPVRTPRSVRATLDVDLGERLRLRGRGLDAFLRGQLRLTTPNNRLAVHGTVRTENGTYAAYGQRLEIERGLVTFLGPVENPRLDIVALRPNLDVRVGVAVGGTALNPRVRLFSEPEMSETDKLSWLVLGRAPEGLGRADTALLQRAAMALLSGEGEGSDRVLQVFGIDEFSVRQEGEGDVRNTVVALGKQLSRRWYLGYERGLSSTTGTWQLIYRIAQRFTLRAQAGEDNAVDLIWSWRW